MRWVRTDHLNRNDVKLYSLWGAWPQNVTMCIAGLCSFYNANGGGRELSLLCVWVKLEQQEDKQKRPIGGFRLHSQATWICAALLQVFGLLEGSGSYDLGEGGGRGVGSCVAYF